MFVVENTACTTFWVCVLPGSFESSERNFVRTVSVMQRIPAFPAEAISNDTVVSDVVAAWKVDLSFCSTKVVDLNSGNISIQLSYILNMRTVRVDLAENDVAKNAAFWRSNGGEDNFVDGSCLREVAKLI